MPAQISLSEASRRLNLSAPMVSRLVAAGALTAETDPTDRRRRLVPERQVEQLARLRQARDELNEAIKKGDRP